MWKIILSDKAEIELRQSLTTGKFSSDDLKVLISWTSFVEKYGPQQLENYYKWDDHPLWGQWEGCRSSCISNSGRIIYKVIDNEIIVLVLRVTPNHNYR